MKTDFPATITVVKRDGTVTNGNPAKIQEAIRRAYIDVHGHGGQAMENFVAEATAKTVEHIGRSLARSNRASIHVEAVQDAVELVLMRMDDAPLAKGYILFREARAQERAARNVPEAPTEKKLSIVLEDGSTRTLGVSDLEQRIAAEIHGLDVDTNRVATMAWTDLFDGCAIAQVDRALIASAKTLIEQDPAYDFLAARLVITGLRAEVIGQSFDQDPVEAYRQGFAPSVRRGVEGKRIAAEMLEFDLDALAASLVPQRDEKFRLLGIGTLAERYFLRVNGRRIEMPQYFWMRVAMGLAVKEVERERWAIEFYNMFSSFDFVSSTPTLFNAGTIRPQLASCFLTTIPDDLDGIYEAIKDNAMLQKYAGGLGNDWTRVRALGAYIQGTDGKSQGVIPFAKVANDTAVAVNQGGKRPGAVCAYLETWHMDIDEFLALRKNTGDDLRRTHNMNTAHWVPDLFMQRVAQKADWTLFSPDEVPHLHDLYGRAFEAAYVECERRAANGKIKLFKTVNALEMWRKMLSMLFETGHPWLTWKDPCNIRSPQDHAGVVHSSNLCTEITLNTSDTETAVCNIGSVNMAAHVTNDPANGYINMPKLQRTVEVAMRALDNVIGTSLYNTRKARNSNLKHRPVGIGMMGYQTALYELRLPFDSDAAMEFADASGEALAYLAYQASAYLAQERGRYASFKGSKWDRGLMPLDTLELLEQERGIPVEVDRKSRLDWDALRELIATHGMRNSNCVAIAPTATIANIIGVEPSIEPAFANLAVKSNLGGEFTQLNHYLVRDLKAIGLWNKAMVADLKAYDGSLERIDRVPADIKALYKTAFEVDPLKVILGGALRQKWIDQAQSLNLWMRNPNGKLLSTIYETAWRSGVKTTYYLRTISATSAEKSTITTGRLNAVPVATAAAQAADGPVCNLRPGDAGYAECDSCQ